MPQMVNPFGRTENYTGTGLNASDILFTSHDVSTYNTFTIMTTAGNVFLEANLDGTNWTTVALALQDLGATTPTTYVTATAATGRLYAFYGKVRQIRMKQSGASASTGFLFCGIQ